MLFIRLESVPDNLGAITEKWQARVDELEPRIAELKEREKAMEARESAQKARGSATEKLRSGYETATSLLQSLTESQENHVLQQCIKTAEQTLILCEDWLRWRHSRCGGMLRQ